MRVAWLFGLAACGGGNGDALRVATSFVVTDAAGAGMSSLDPLQGQTLDIEIVWPSVEALHGANDSPGCKTTVVGFFPEPRTAKGASAVLVQQEILDKLDNWEVRLQLCEPGSGQSTVGLVATIDALNLAFGCFGVPPSAQVAGGDGYPELTTFTATQCSSTILDVVANRVFSNPGFAMTIDTGPARIP